MEDHPPEFITEHTIPLETEQEQQIRIIAAAGIPAPTIPRQQPWKTEVFVRALQETDRL
jgi:hypothetical protein